MPRGARVREEGCRGVAGFSCTSPPRRLGTVLHDVSFLLAADCCRGIVCRHPKGGGYLSLLRGAASRSAANRVNAGAVAAGFVTRALTMHASGRWVSQLIVDALSMSLFPCFQVGLEPAHCRSGECRSRRFAQAPGHKPRSFSVPPIKLGCSGSFNSDLPGFKPASLVSTSNSHRSRVTNGRFP